MPMLPKLGARNPWAPESRWGSCQVGCLIFMLRAVSSDACPMQASHASKARLDKLLTKCLSQHAEFQTVQGGVQRRLAALEKKAAKAEGHVVKGKQLLAQLQYETRSTELQARSCVLLHCAPAYCIYTDSVRTAVCRSA